MKTSFSRALKFNPYHDEKGRFASKDKAKLIVGDAARAVGEHTYLDDKKKPKKEFVDALIARALPDPARRAQYLQQLREADEGMNGPEATYKKHSKNGDGTGGYTKERKALHKAILDKLFEDVENFFPKDGQKPTMVLLGGRGGSGKSNFDAVSVEKQGLDPKMAAYDSRTMLHLDSDKIKEMLPDYHPAKAALVHEESSYLFKAAVKMARDIGVNVVLDATMRSSPAHWVSEFRRSNYEVNAAYMIRPPEKAAESAVTRWNAGGKKVKVTDVYGTTREYDHGRLVPVEVVLLNLNNEKHFDGIRNIVDNWKLVDHSGELGQFKVVTNDVKLAPKKKPAKKSEYGVAFKANPYHDKLGRFASAPGGGGTAKKSEYKRVFKENPYRAADGEYTTKELAVWYKKPNGDLVPMRKPKPDLKDVPSVDVHAGIAKLTGVKAAAKKLGGGTLKTSPKHSVLDNGDVLTSHKHIFFDGKAADAKLPSVIAEYEKAGYKKVDGTPKNPGEFSVEKNTPTLHTFNVLHAAADVKPSMDGVAQSIAQGKPPADKDLAKPDKTPEKAPDKAPDPAPEAPKVPKAKPVQPAELPKPPEPKTPMPKAPTAGDFNDIKIPYWQDKYWASHKKKIEAALAIGGEAGEKLLQATAVIDGRSVAFKKAAQDHLKAVEQWKQDNITEGKPTLDYLTGKKREKAEALVEEFKQKYLDQMMKSEKELFFGKSGAAATALKPLSTMEKRLLAAGVSPIDIEKFRQQNAGALNSHRQAVIDSFKAKIDKGVDILWASKGDSGWDNTALYQYTGTLVDDVSNYGYLVGPSMGLSEKASTTQYVLEAYKRKLVKAKNELVDAYEAVTLAKVDTPEWNDALAVAKRKVDAISDQKGIDSAAIESLKAVGQAKAKIGEKITTAADAKIAAINAYGEEGKQTVLAGYHGQSTGMFPEAGKNLKEAKIQKIAAALVAKKFGITLSSDEQYSAVQAGKTLAYSEINSLQEKIESVGKLVTEKMQKSLMAKKLGMPFDDAELDNAVKAAEATGFPADKIQFLKDKGESQYETEVAQLVVKAKTELHSAAYSYEYAKANQGKDHPDTAAAKKLFKDSIQFYGKHLPDGTTTYDIRDQARAAVTNAIKAAEAMKKLLNGDATAVAKSFDTESFVYPDHDSSGAFFKAQKKMADQLSPKAKSILTSYSGSAYTTINKEIGAYGTAIMTGQKPPELSSSKKSLMKELDETFKTFKLGANIKLRRNMPANYLLKQLGISTEYANKVPKAELKSLVGKIYKETAYSSTSTDPNFGSAYSSAESTFGRIVLKIRAKADLPGINIAPFSQHSSENEVVLGRGTTYLIRSVKRANQYEPIVIEVDALGMFPD